MKHSKSKEIYRPFENLKTLLQKKSLTLKSDRQNLPPVTSPAANNLQTELSIFEDAMADVQRIYRDNCVEKRTTAQAQPFHQNDNASEILLALEDLIKHGTGFVVAQTPEYIEGTAYNVNPEITKRLHRGDFAIQGHIDLHGLNVEDARDAFESFLEQSIVSGKRVVLIIHGRGLSSPKEPILKTNVHKWLTSGPWRKWILSFSSARWCDGGAGATYILLRQRPQTKRSRKKRNLRKDLKNETQDTNS
ncbi:MAG: Smr/MutS family protein [Desulfobacterales bacterium]|jgi:DNA-nicking Smr family endonuclease